MLICVSGFVVGSPHKVDRPAPGPGQIASSYTNWAIAKKGTVRNNGEVLKRTRIQTAYELSQDLQDKRIEMLERKYGGVKARVAALTIQRAFRRYTLLKKFAAITAMAKAEKRLSRRLQNSDICQTDGTVPSTVTSSPGGPAGPAPGVQQHRPGVPVRSLSLRERERRANEYVPMPRSQSGCCSEPYECYPSGAMAPSCHDSSVTYWDSTTAHYYSPHESYSEHDMNSSLGSARALMSPPPHLLSHSHPGQQQHQQPLGGDPWASPTPCSCHPCPCQSACPCPCLVGLVPGPHAASHDSYSNSTSSSPAGSVASYQMRPHSHHQHRKVKASPLCDGTSLRRGFAGPDSKLSPLQVPPDVPKRTSSITPGQNQGRGLAPARLSDPRNSHGGSISSVHSSGSDSSSHTATASLGGSAGSAPGMGPALGEDGHNRPTSPLWKRKDQDPCSPECQAASAQPGAATYTSHHQATTDQQEAQHVFYKVSETVRKRQYRVGLNLFNKKPERGISYLIRRGFLENSPQGVARFLITRKGLSKQMIGEYLGNLQSPFNMAVLDCFAEELDLCGMAVDVALRKFQSYFRMPGEAQKIERLMEIFSTRYCRCNADVIARLRSPDTVFVLAFAIIMLNTDLHTPNIKPERRMKLDDFIKNLRGIDDCHDIDRDILAGIYDRVKANEFKPGSDHVTQVMKVQSTIVGKKPNMALPHRRLVCYCRLYEVPDPYKKERPGVHQREVFLFNDLLVITKILSKKKSSVTYTFRQSFPLCGMMVNLFDVPYYPYGIRLSQRVDGKVLVTFNARNEHDRCKFAEDLRESVCEMDEMENLRIEAELERQKSSHAVRATRNGAAGSASGSINGNSDNRDSGVADVEGLYSCGGPEGCVRGDSDAERERMASTDIPLKRSALSNSLLDIHEQFAGEKPQRRGSVGSLDSGMSISFQSTSASTVSRDSSPQNVQPSPGMVVKGAGKVACHPQSLIQSHPHPVVHAHNHVVHPSHQGLAGHPGHPSFLGGLFAKRERKVLRGDENSPFSRSTEV